MGLKTVFQIFGDPCIEGFVAAFQDVDNPAQESFLKQNVEYLKNVLRLFNSIIGNEVEKRNKEDSCNEENTPYMSGYSTHVSFSARYF